MRKFLLVSLLLPLLVACAGGDDGQSAPNVDGPALVMFYTDN